MIALVPMTEGDFPGFFEAATRSHADNNVAAGRWHAHDAMELSREETRRLLPENAGLVAARVLARFVG